MLPDKTQATARQKRRTRTRLYAGSHIALDAVADTVLHRWRRADSYRANSTLQSDYSARKTSGIRHCTRDSTINEEKRRQRTTSGASLNNLKRMKFVGMVIVLVVLTQSESQIQ